MVEDRGMYLRDHPQDTFALHRVVDLQSGMREENTMITATSQVRVHKCQHNGHHMMHEAHATQVTQVSPPASTTRKHVLVLRKMI